MKTWRCSCEGHCGKSQLHWHNERFPSPTSFELVLPTTNHRCQWCQISVEVKEPRLTSNIMPDNQPKRLTEQQPLPSSWSERWKRFKEEWRPSSQLVVPVLVDKNSISLETAAESPSLVSCLCSYVNNVKTGQKRSIFCIEENDRHFALDAKLLHGESLKTITVASILSDKDKILLSRRQRFSIAAATVWGLLCLYGSPWINSEDWNGKDELQIFVEEKGHLELLANECPTISYVLRSMVTGRRGPSSAAPTAAPLGDHAYQSSLIRNKILFSLGIFLIELCLNKSFEQLRQESQSSHPTGPGGKQPSVVDDYEIADRQLDKIYLDAGNSYGYAVQRCLRCEFPGIRHEEELRLPTIPAALLQRRGRSRAGHVRNATCFVLGVMKPMS
ncbi:hypothetical protein F5X99DRAFT_24454 [Biscogniauxia marginata]|nr:hypothetical protein F5X99DRAFT_24454 [Biscogniauxia marginata]